MEAERAIAERVHFQAERPGQGLAVFDAGAVIATVIGQQQVAFGGLPLGKAVLQGGVEAFAAGIGRGGGDIGDWLGASIGLFIAAVVCVVVVPLVLLLGVALPLLIVCGVVAVVLAALLGAGAVLGSPVILLGLLLFVVLRNRNRAMKASAERTEPV